jgi:hypothetical protein
MTLLITPHPLVVQECTAELAAPLNDLVEIIYSICTSSVQLSHHLRENLVRNRSCETAFPKPGFGRDVCMMASRTVRKSFERYSCFEASARDVPKNVGSLLKSLESDVDVC